MADLSVMSKCGADDEVTHPLKMSCGLAAPELLFLMSGHMKNISVRSKEKKKAAILAFAVMG